MVLGQPTSLKSNYPVKAMLEVGSLEKLSRWCDGETSLAMGKDLPSSKAGFFTGNI